MPSRNIKDFSKIYNLNTDGASEIYGHGETSLEDSMKCQKEQLLISWKSAAFSDGRFT